MRKTVALFNIPKESLPVIRETLSRQLVECAKDANYDLLEDILYLIRNIGDKLEELEQEEDAE